MALNKVQLIGNLGDEVKMHYFEGGGCIGRVSMATSFQYTKKGETEKKTITEWHNLVFRNKTAEAIEKYTKKGSKLYVEGRLGYRKWQGEDGKDNYTTEINVQSFEFLTPKGESSNNISQAPPTPPSEKEEEDDLPF